MKRIFALALMFTSTVALAQNVLPAATGYEVALSWDAPASCGAPSSSCDPVAGYFAYRSLHGAGSFAALNESALTATSYDDTDLTYPATYDYYVASADADGNESAPSNMVTIAVPFVPYAPVLGAITEGS